MAPTIDAAIRRYLADLAIGKTAKTVNTYQTALNRFRVFWHRERLGRKGEPERIDDSIDSLDIEAPVDFLRWYQREHPGATKSTLFTYSTAVMRFYAYLVREDLRPDLPLAKIQMRVAALRGKRPRMLPRVPSDNVVERILKAAREAPKGDNPDAECARLRNIALIETLRGSGIRVSEAVSLRRGDLVRENRTARVIGKGDKERIIYFTDSAWRAIEAYLQARRDGAVGQSLASLPLFARHDSRSHGRVLPLSTRTVQTIVMELARAAGVEEAAVTPHRFRAWFATYLVERSGDLAAVQDLLGHESANTTRIYTKVAARRLGELHRQAFANEPVRAGGARRDDRLPSPSASRSRA